MAVITPTTIWRESMGSLTFFANQCNAVSNGDTLNCPSPPVMFWGTVTSQSALASSASVSITASGSTLTVNITSTIVSNLRIAYVCAA